MNIANNKWHHIAVTRSNATGALKIFVDGKLDASGTGPKGSVSYRNGRATSYPNSDPHLVLGAEKHDAGAAYPSYNGYFDELRISKVIRYTANFTRPAAPFSTGANTLALYHFDEGPAGNCAGIILDSSAFGRSQGQYQFGGNAPAGPSYAAVSPFSAHRPGPIHLPRLDNQGNAGAHDRLGQRHHRAEMSRYHEEEHLHDIRKWMGHPDHPLGKEGN